MQNFKLSDCQIYTSCEPCPMCFGAICWSGITQVYFGANRYAANDAGFIDAWIYKELDLPMDLRKVKFELIYECRGDAHKVFDAWKALSTRVPY